MKEPTHGRDNHLVDELAAKIVALAAALKRLQSGLRRQAKELERLGNENDKLVEKLAEATGQTRDRA
jgi:hypothetical protein